MNRQNFPIFRSTLALFLFGLSFVVQAQEEWITEEVLQQLTEIRQELKSLREQVQSLGEKLEGNLQRDDGEKLVSIDLDLFPILGDKGANLAIIEFSDYQCPYCKRHFNQTFPQLKVNFIDKGLMQYAISDYPLGFHPQARPAAKAVHCAGEQKENSNWAMHESLFSGRHDLSEQSYSLIAQEIGLDGTLFSDCVKNPDLDSAIDKSMRFAENFGVKGTPAFLVGKIVGNQMVNPIFISGAQPYSTFAEKINKLLLVN